MGLVMALSENGQAMRRFAALSDDTREQIIAEARTASSREDMLAIVRSLT